MLVTMPIETWRRRVSSVLSRGLALGLACMLPLIAGLPAAAQVEVFEVAPQPPVPLPIVSPGFLFVYQPGPTPPSTLGQGRWQVRFDLSESNVLHPADELEAVFETEVDFELSRFQVAVDYGLTEEWDLGVELPLYYFHGGFLDHSVREAERAVGKLKPRRRDEEQGDFTYRLRRGGETLLEIQDDHVGLGDVVLSAKRSLWAQHGRRPELAVRAAVKIPTGTPDEGRGSGTTDLSIGTAAGWSFAPFTLTAGLHGTLRLGQPARPSELTAMPTLGGWAEVSYPLTPRLTLHAQLAASTQPFRTDSALLNGLPEGETRTFTGHVFQLTPAISWRLDSGSSLYFGVVEDFLKSENTASDVTVLAGVRLPARVFGE